MKVCAKDKSDALQALVQSVQKGQVKRIRQSLESLLTVTALEFDPDQVGILKNFANSIKLDREMLSTGQVAKKLGVSSQAVINWIKIALDNEGKKLKDIDPCDIHVMFGALEHDCNILLTSNVDDFPKTFGKVEVIRPRTYDGK
ncbi:MAG: hypothetical protein ACYDEJ_02885 [Desulfitobacteriaceae bacterium]